jgi:hypothetical protein
MTTLSSALSGSRPERSAIFSMCSDRKLPSVPMKILLHRPPPESFSPASQAQGEGEGELSVTRKDQSCGWTHRSHLRSHGEGVPEPRLARAEPVIRGSNECLALPLPKIGGPELILRTPQ